MELEFFGAAGEVTGSCHVLKVGDKKVLLDCGLIQGSRKDGRRNRDPFPFDAAKIDAVVLSHAHIDHSGRLPLLVKRGFNGRIYTHNASRDLCEILLADSAYLGERDTERENRRRQRKGKPPLEPLYTGADAQAAVRKLEGIRYDEATEVVPGVRATFYDAGHIMGSAVVEIEAREGSNIRRVVFSGDVGQYDTPILRDPVSPKHADVVLMESTYGGRRHRDRSETVKELGDIVSAARKDRGNIMIPAFAVGRSQELLYQFGKHYQDWDISRWRIYLDSPMAIKASHIYWDYDHLYDDEATKLRGKRDVMPPLPNLRLTSSADESRAINQQKNGAIIIAGSGMCNGGRILHHIKHNIWRKECHLIICGYQAVGSIGRRIVDGKKFVRVHGEAVRIAATVHTVGGLSAHGDEQDLADWYGRIENRPPVFLVHGEKRSAKKLADKLKRDFATKVTLSDPGMRLDLDSMKVIDGGVPLKAIAS